MNNISIVWDFDGTLTPKDSTTQVIEFLDGEKAKTFWYNIHKITGKKIKQNSASKEEEWKHILALDAPVWMYTLSRIAFSKAVPLNNEFFKKFIIPEIKLYDNVIEFLAGIKSLESSKDFRKLNIKIHHFIVSAGLKDLIDEVFPKGLMTYVFGCRYKQLIDDENGAPENIPIYCVDETAKTRSLFEISKGSFLDESKPVNKRIEKKELFCPFENIIYIGDGDTDIPSLSLTRDKGGTGIVVHNQTLSEKKMKDLKSMSLDKRSDLITKADFSLDGELYNFVKEKCLHIMLRYRAESFGNSN